MLAAQCVPHNHVVRLRAVATPRVNAATRRKSCVVHGKVTAAQLREREAVQARISTVGTPVVDYLLETSPYARFLDGPAIASIREREKSLGDANVAEKLRRLRIAFANKGRKPWNVGKHHNHATIEKIRKGVARAMQDPAVIDKLRKSYVAQTPETREKMRKKIQLRYGIQLHKQAFGARSKNSNSVATTGVAVFHCHIGCSALIGFRRVGWRRSTVFQKRPASRKVRRKMSPEELEASREKARQRVAEAMRKKWADPRYRARQTEAIRISHAENPRTRSDSTPRISQARRSSRPRRSQQSAYQKRLENQRRDLQATLQQLQETRAYHAKFAGVVAKLQAQGEALSMQPDAQQQVEEALVGVLASQDKAQGSITVLEEKANKLQQQLESTELVLAKEEKLKTEALKKVEAQENASSSAADVSRPPSVHSTGSVGERDPHPSGASVADADSLAGAASEPEQNQGHAAGTDGAGVPGPSYAAGLGAVAGKSGSSDAHSFNGNRAAAGSHAAHTGMAAEQAAGDSTGAQRDGAVADVGLNGTPQSSGAAAAHENVGERGMAAGPALGNGIPAHENGNGAVAGVHKNDAASLHNGMGLRVGGNGGYLRDDVDLGRVAEIADGGAAMKIPTAAEWKGKMFDTSHNGHVVLNAYPRASSVGCVDGSPDTAASGAVLVKQVPPDARGAGSMHRVENKTPEAGAQPGRGGAHSSGNHSPSQEVVDSEEEDRGGSLNWLQKRAHKLPWQE